MDCLSNFLEWLVIKGAFPSFSGRLKGVVAKNFLGGCAPKPPSTSPDRSLQGPSWLSTALVIAFSYPLLATPPLAIIQTKRLTRIIKTDLLSLRKRLCTSVNCDSLFKCSLKRFMACPQVSGRNLSCKLMNKLLISDWSWNNLLVVYLEEHYFDPKFKFLELYFHRSGWRQSITSVDLFETWRVNGYSSQFGLCFN